jgi:hypothetical protein
MQGVGLACAGGKTRRGRSATLRGLAYGGWWALAFAVLRPARQQVAVSPKAEAGDKHRLKVREPYQLMRWSNTYSGAAAGASAPQGTDDDARPQQRGRVARAVAGFDARKRTIPTGSRGSTPAGQGSARTPPSVLRFIFPGACGVQRADQGCAGRFGANAPPGAEGLVARDIASVANASDAAGRRER